MTKKILVSLSIIGAVAAIIIGGTVAYFSDTETSTGNTFSAGTLDLAVGEENPNQSPDFTISNVKPGDSGTITYILKNVGTIAGYLDLSGISATSSEGQNPESETGDTSEPGELLDNLYVIVKIGDTQLYSGLLSQIASSYDADILLAGNNATTSLTIDWVVDKDNTAPLGADVGNDIQGDTATVSFTIELDQNAD